MENIEKSFRIYMEKNKSRKPEEVISEFATISFIPIVDIYKLHEKVYGESDWAKNNIKRIQDFMG